MAARVARAADRADAPNWRADGAMLTDPEYRDYLAAFLEELHKPGWTEGRNIQIDTRWGALDDAEVRLRSANELIALQPDLR
jgi:hypothetical protein